jgi:hypothetical protein
MTDSDLNTKLAMLNSTVYAANQRVVTGLTDLSHLG